MQLGIFGPVSYYAPDIPRGVPQPPRYYRSSHGVESMQSALRIFELADDLGFDHVAVAEHHFASRQLTPDPNLFAAALTQRVRNAKIAVLGVLLPMIDPLRVAEQFAMLDTLSNGRLIAGVFRGTPNELAVYHTNPAESRARYEEAVRLIQHCFTEPEPFGWEGVYYRYRTIGLWPQPVQKPLRLLVSGNSIDSARFAGKNQLQMAFSLADLSNNARYVSEFKTEASAVGWKPSPYDLLTRYIIYVGATDEKAREEFVRHSSSGPALDPRRIKYMQQLMTAGRGPSPVPPTSPTKTPVPPTAGATPLAGGFPALIGAPDTLLRGMEQIVKTTGVGRFDLIFTGDRLPDELGIASLELFAKEMLPTLKALDPQPAFDALGDTASDAPQGSVAAAQ